jgi:hypothetical protein
VRVAVLGAPGPAARPSGSRRAGAGKGIETIVVCGSVDFCGLPPKSTVSESHTAPFCVYVLGTVASDGPATTRRATASATPDRAILKLHDTMSDFRFLHVPLAVLFLPEEALRYQWEIGTELAALWSTALVLAQNAVSILRH